MSPEPGDGSASPDPESGSEDESGIMAEEKTARTSADEKSPNRAGSGSKPSTKSNAKDPSRPRRKKARRACFACQRAHLTCGMQCFLCNDSSTSSIESRLTKRCRRRTTLPTMCQTWTSGPVS
jgi:hypothetical protein